MLTIFGIFAAGFLSGSILVGFGCFCAVGMISADMARIYDHDLMIATLAYPRLKTIDNTNLPAPQS